MHFDIAIRLNLAVAATVLSDSEGNIISAAFHRLPLVEAYVGEVHATLLAAQLAVSSSLVGAIPCY
jgi:hypothetical protein